MYFTLDLDVFISNLLKTQEYCHIQMNNNIAADGGMIDVASVFRSYNPVYMGHELFEYRVKEIPDITDTEFILVKAAFWAPGPAHHFNSVRDLYLDQMAHKDRCVGDIKTQTPYAGRIAISIFDAGSVEASDSAPASYYLFDDEDFPPIDTWFYFTDIDGYRTLFAWIPEPYMKYVEAAIPVNDTKCIGWFENMFPEEYAFFWKRFSKEYVSKGTV